MEIVNPDSSLQPSPSIPEYQPLTQICRSCGRTKENHTSIQTQRECAEVELLRLQSKIGHHPEDFTYEGLLEAEERCRVLKTFLNGGTSSI